MKNSMFLIAFLFVLFGYSELLSQSEKRVMIVVPNKPDVYDNSYDNIKDLLKQDPEIVIKYLESSDTWADIKLNHGLTDSVSIEDRKDYFINSDVDYYLELVQSKKVGTGLINTTVTIYSETKAIPVNWRCKEEDSQHYRNLQIFNLDKIKYAILNNKRKEDIVLIKTVNNINDGNLKRKYYVFADKFAYYMETADSSISANYFFNPLVNTNTIEPNAKYVLYDVKIDVELTDETDDGYLLVTINMDSEIINLEDKPEPYSQKVRQRIPIDVAIKDIAKKFITENKAWLLKDH